MKKAIPAVVLELTAKIFSEASSKAHDALAKTLTLPVKEGFVKVSIDGREVDLLLDSGFAEISVLDGDWYEREFGKNACEERRSACFFCPKENPCDYDGSEYTIKTSFADNTTIQSVLRSGSLSLDGCNATDFIFRVSRYSRWNNGPLRPWGHFGIAQLFPVTGRSRRRPGLESVLDALKRRHLIGRLSYTLRSKAGAASALNLISGQLTLGDIPNEQMTFISWKYLHGSGSHRAFTATWVSSVKLFDAEGNLSVRESSDRKYPSSFLSTIDTGSNRLVLPLHLDDDIVKELKRRLKKKGYSGEQISKVGLRRKNGFLYLHKSVYEYLPVIGLRLDDGFNSIPIKIHPKHYSSYAGKGEIVIFTVFGRDEVSLGTPLFRAYSVHVDYTNHTIALFENT
ncbi:hypothetical protein FOZ62_031194 [Perkinsus olseni]|uniref:Uncharacterized protein n=1 Tax=Perkinsus olseni TaxID=32597 RepID=A0A7J6RBP5_PEROL|nr:hypothetical protein FOZ62_031194 [Perkinsus olseni]